jgi:hypothetical protein
VAATRLFQDDVAQAPFEIEWGSRGSGRRLKKMAYTIAALTRNAKRRGLQMAEAVSEWGSGPGVPPRPFLSWKIQFSVAGLSASCEQKP